MSNIVVAGGGIAGAAAASLLAQAGRQVTLIEREAAPVDKICGEFLSHEAQAYLSKLGLDLNLLGGAPISRLRLVRGERVIETNLPFPGIGLSRRTLDEAMLRHAAQSGAQVLRGHTIRSLKFDGALKLDVAGHGELKPATVLLATGKHELRGAKRQVENWDDLVGFKMIFRLHPAAQAELARHIELILFAGGYAGLQMIEDGLANFCLLVQRDRFIECGGAWPALLELIKTQSPYLAGQLHAAAPQLKQPLAIARVPFGFIHRFGPADHRQIFRLGDQACVIHSFTGDGMAIALHSAALAARMIVQGKDAGLYHRRLKRDVSFQMKRADMLAALLNHPVTQPMMFGLANFWPASLQQAARLTRVPLRARL